jgi:hypothetical protein
MDWRCGDPAVTGSALAGSFMLPAGTVVFLLTHVEAEYGRGGERRRDAARTRHVEILGSAVSLSEGCPMERGRATARSASH